MRRSLVWCRPPFGNCRQVARGARSKLALERDQCQRGLRRATALVLARRIGANDRLIDVLDRQDPVADAKPL